MSTKIMTFAKFQDSKLHLDNINPVIGDDIDGETPGYVYCPAYDADGKLTCGFWISEGWEGAAHIFRTTIVHELYESQDLEEIEWILWNEWAHPEGEFFDPNDQKDTDPAIEDALNAACLAIQNRIGQTDGGVASIFFSGEERENFAAVMRRYIALEATYAKGD